MPRRIIPEPVPAGHKWCSQCSTVLPVQRFGVDRSTADARRYACRRCMTTKDRQLRAIKRVLSATYRRLTVPL